MVMPAHVKNRSAREHVARITKLIWSDPEQPVSIFELEDRHRLVIEALPEEFVTNQLYRFIGRWVDSSRGTQFKASSFTWETPTTKNALTLYLAKSCTGIGKKKAGELWEKYGADATRVLREETQRVVDDKVLSLDTAQQAARDLIGYAVVERTAIELSELFAGRGFPGKLINECISRWGAKAPEFIRTNPYRLLVNRMTGAGWKRCDKLYLDMGGRKDSLKRQFLAGYYALSGDRSGSTWIEKSKAVSAIRENVKGADPEKALKLGLRSQWILTHDEGKKSYIARNADALAEQVITRSALNLRNVVSWHAMHNEWLKIIEKIETLAAWDDFKDWPSDHQIQELKKACEYRIGCFTGGPGSGKTFTLSFLLREVVAYFGLEAVAVAAPTGKAAVRATEALAGRGLSIRATTIHKLLRIGGAGKVESYGPDNPLPYRFLVIDEASMIDTTLMALLLQACSDGTHVLLVGDPYQLAPVGHGCPFKDLIRSGACGVGQLTEIRRNAGTIVRACAAIKEGRRIDFPEKIDADADDPANLGLIDVPGDDVPERIERLIQGITKFDRIEEVQVITALNAKSESSRTRLNERLAKLLNPDGQRVEGCPFAVGDKVICTANGDLRAVEAWVAGGYKSVANATHYVANGEMGRVRFVSQKEFVVDWGNERLTAVNIGKGRRKGEESKSLEADEQRAEQDKGNPMEEDKDTIKIELGYAITVHRSQGSEWPLVIVAIDPSAGMVADRNFWYTAISRAKKVGILVGPETTLRTQCNRVSVDKRKTLLVESLVPMIVEV